MPTTEIAVTVTTANTISYPESTSTQVSPVITPTEEILPTIKVTPSPDVITLDNAKRVRPTGKTFWSSWRNAELVFRPDATWIVEPLRDGGIIVRDFHTEELKKSLPNAGEWIEHILVSPDGRRLAAVSTKDETISVWDLDSFTILGIYPFTGYHPSSEGTPLAGSFSHNNGFLTVSGCLQQGTYWGNPYCWYSGAVVYDLDTNGIFKELAGYQESTYSVEFSPDDRLLVLAGRGRSKPRADLLVWDIHQNKLLMKMEYETGLGDINFNCKGNLLASITFKGELVMWNTSTWLPEGPVEGNGPGEVSYSPVDCSLLATTDGLNVDGLTFWNADTLQPIYTWETSMGKLDDVAISPDGRRGYTWSNDLGPLFRIQEWFIP